MRIHTVQIHHAIHQIRYQLPQHFHYLSLYGKHFCLHNGEMLNMASL